MDDLTKARVQRALADGTGGSPIEVARYILNDIASQDPPADAYMLIGVWRDAGGRITNTSLGRCGIPPAEAVGVLERVKLLTFLSDASVQEDDE